MSEAWIIWDGELPVDVKRSEDMAREFAHQYLLSNAPGLVCIQGPIAGPTQAATIPALGVIPNTLVVVAGRGEG